MNKAEVSKLTAEIARPYGYRRKAGRFWIVGDELYRLIDLQASVWGKGLYVNFGVMPKALVTKPVPPGPGDWGWQHRGSGIEGSYQEQFLRCEDDNDDEMNPHEMIEPMCWLIGWIEENVTETA